MMMHPGDDMLNDTMNEGDWDVIARGGVTGDGGDGWVAALTSVNELSCGWWHGGCVNY